MNELTMLNLLSTLQTRFDKLEWNISEYEEFVTCIKINQRTDEGYFISIKYVDRNLESYSSTNIYSLKIDFRRRIDKNLVDRAVIKRVSGTKHKVLKELDNWLCDMSTAFSKIQPE
jgi:hypothetical protein